MSRYASRKCRWLTFALKEIYVSIAHEIYDIYGLYLLLSSFFAIKMCGKLYGGFAGLEMYRDAKGRCGLSDAWHKNGMTINYLMVIK